MNDIIDFLEHGIAKQLKYFDAKAVAKRFVNSRWYDSTQPFKKVKKECLSYIATMVALRGEDWYLK